MSNPFDPKLHGAAAARAGGLVPLRMRNSARACIIGTVADDQRAALKDLFGRVQTADSAQVLALLKAPARFSNPLYSGVALAMLNSNGAPVSFVPVDDAIELPDRIKSLAAWRAAVDVALKEPGVYSIVALTCNADVQNYVRRAVATVEEVRQQRAISWEPVIARGAAATSLREAVSLGAEPPYQNARVRRVWCEAVCVPEYTQYNLVSAALAGLRSGVQPHEDLTGLQVKLFEQRAGTLTPATQDTPLTEALTWCARNGVWAMTSSVNCLTTFESTTGIPAVSCDPLWSDTVVTNIDAIHRQLSEQAKELLRQADSIPVGELASLMRARLKGQLNMLKSIRVGHLPRRLVNGTVTVRFEADKPPSFNLSASVDITVPARDDILNITLNIL